MASASDVQSRCYELHGVRVFECPAVGAELRNDRDAVELIGLAGAHEAALIALPVTRLADAERPER